MKYQNVNSFKKHLKGAFPNHLCPIYLVIIADSYERWQMLEYVAGIILKKKNYSLWRYSTKDPLDQILSNFNNPSLFGEYPLVILDELEALKKSDIPNLTSFLKRSDIVGHVIFGAKTKGAMGNLYTEIERKGVILDFTFEKVWEREKRFSEFVIERCSLSKKCITISALEAFFERVGLDMASVEKEIDKIIIFCGDREKIEKGDVLAISHVTAQSTIWQLAEEIIWGEDIFCDESIDVTFFHGLITALRYHLQVGYKIASFIENGTSLQNFTTYFPHMRPKLFEKRKKQAAKFGSLFFQEGLKELFTIDLLSKNNVSSFSTLLDIFRSKLTYFKNEI